jgi:hypothetical protein
VREYVSSFGNFFVTSKIKHRAIERFSINLKIGMFLNLHASVLRLLANLLVSKSPCLFLLPPLLVCRIRQIHTRRHAQTQLVLRIFDEHAHFVNQTGAQLLGLHRFGCKLRDR